METIKSYRLMVNDKVEPSLFDTTAMEIAKKLISKDSKGKPIGVTRSQIRRIFDEIKRLQKDLTQKNNWDEILPLIKLVKAKTAYTSARAKSSDKYYYTNLNYFIDNGIDQINSKKNFDTFCLLFEAVYGFYYELGGANTQ